MYSTSIELWEILLSVFYLMFSTVIVFVYPSSTDRQWFAIGMTARIFGAICYALIYLYYYGGGDTLAYYHTALPFSKMLISDPVTGFKLLFDDFSIENYSKFTAETGYPIKYIYSEQNTLMVSKLVTPFLVVSFNSYFIASILIATTTFLGPWKLYTLLRTLAPNANKIAIFSTLLFPSVIFWGSGISKDTFIYAAVCYFIYGFYSTLIKREFSIVKISLSILMVYLIIVIKPYIFLVLFPGILIWFFFSQIQRIKNKLLRLSIIPIILVFSFLIFAFTYSTISSFLGDYSSTEKIIEKAVVSQEDLLRDFYGGNSFDIGEIEPTVLGVVSKFPIATFFGFYGPTLIHVTNVVSLFSALENTFLLALTILVFGLRNPITQFRLISSSPFLIFCLSFSIFLAFAIGLTTPNFGALIRFKIPMIPFFCFMLLVLYNRKTVLV